MNNNNISEKMRIKGMYKEVIGDMRGRKEEKAPIDAKRQEKAPIR